MHKCSFNIDWLTLVVDDHTEPRLGLPGIAKALVPSHGRWGYDTGHDDQIQGYTRLTSSTRQDMGICYVFSATAMDILASAGRYQNRLAALKAFGATWGKCTRLDLCLDVHDTGLLAYVVADLAEKQLIDARSKKVTVVRNIPAGTGVTTYLGARSSPTYVRIYDKNAESKGRVPVTRFELECKAEIADQLAALIFAGNSTATLEETVIGAFLGLCPSGIASLLMTYSQDIALWSLEAERIYKRTQRLG